VGRYYLVFFSSSCWGMNIFSLLSYRKNVG
jgi:hypothetical protein